MTVIKFTEATSDYFQGTSSSNPTSEEKFQDLIINNNTVNKAVIDTSLWQPSTNYVVGDTRKSPSMTAGMFAICTVLGTSGTSEPTWSTTTGTTVTDNGVTWVMAKAISSNGGDITGNLTISGNSIALLAYPIGAVYISMVSTSPATLFGGTWAELPAGKVLIGQGMAESGTVYTAGNTGGNETYSLTVANLANHIHSAWTDTQSASGKIYGGGNASPAQDGADGVFSLNGTHNFYASGDRHDGHNVAFNYSHGHNVGIGATGSGTPFSIMQPYLVAYMWQRTA